MIINRKSSPSAGYLSLNGTPNENAQYRFGGYTDEDDSDVESEAESPDEVQRVSSRHRNESLSQQRNHKLKADKPRSEITIVVLEELAVLSVLFIQIVHTFLPPDHVTSRGSRATAVLIWTYISLLTSTRLFFSVRSLPSTSCWWYHTAALYGAFWALFLLEFRSTFIHNDSTTHKVLTGIDFSLRCILLLFALTSRAGNNTEILEYEGDLEPSKELTASVLSIATFSWVDPLLWKGYKKTLEISDVWNLNPEDKADTVLADYRQMRKTTILAWHLLKYFKGQLLKQAIWASFSGALSFVPTLLLKAILEYLEDSNSIPKNIAWLLVVLLFVSGCASALCDAFALWTGRKTCIRLRAIIVGELYAKALRRKITATANKTLGEDKEKRDETKSSSKEPPSPSDDVSKAERNGDNISKPDLADAAEGQVSSGAVINLMAIDSFKVAEITAYMHFLWATTPVQVIVSVLLLYRILGYSSIAGIGMMVILLPVYMFIAKQFTKTQKKILAATDKRIDSTNEALQNIRIIKFFAWERRFISRIDEKRTTELKALRNRYILWTLASAVWSGTPIVITFFSFFFYTSVEKRDLIPSVAFSALSLFQILRAPLDQLADMIAHVQESKVSVDRIEEFLKEAETEKYDQLVIRRSSDNQEPLIGFHNASFTYGNDPAKDEVSTTSFKLMNLNIYFKVNQLNLVIGPTGSGKSSLLLALLGELTKLDGIIYLPGCGSRERLKANSETGLTESVAYCAQQAWLVNDTIRENILFAGPWNPTRYRNVLVACALQKDLDILDHGDKTLVGEKGVTLSGGQKQRISLARALYSKARYIFLDDILSAVDSHTSQWIFSNALLGPLMFNRTCILITHNVSLCLPHSQYIVALENGSVTSHGPPKEVINSGKLGDVSLSTSTSAAQSGIPSRVSSEIDNTHALKYSSSGRKDDDITTMQQSDIRMKGTNANPRTEEKAEGGVKLSVVMFYIRSMGPWYFWALTMGLFALQELASVSTNLWIRQWANAYTAKQSSEPSSIASYSGSAHGSTEGSTHFQVFGNFLARTYMFTPNWTFSSTETQESDVDSNYYLFVYAILGLVYIFITIPREGSLLAGSLNASKKIHTQLLESITHAKFRFFDITPIGQLLNRFSKDIGSIDEEVAPVANGLIWCVVSMITIFIVVSAIMPAFLFAAAIITILFAIIAMLYISSSRDLKRLESVQRSPLYQHFGETLLGMTTIRAYGDEDRFARENVARINVHNRPFIYLWATNRWLAFRVDLVGALVSFSTGVFILLRAQTIDAGAAGLAMSYAVSFTDSLLWFIRSYAANEQAMNSVERVKDYLEVEQEALPIIHGQRPPSNWPSKGTVEFINYSTRYRPDFDLVLKDISFKIEAGEKIGVVGRTGAGKSSLAMALFRALEAQEGKIVIEDVDISLIGLQDLRDNVVIVPQGIKFYLNGFKIKY